MTNEDAYKLGAFDKFFFYTIAKFSAAQEAGVDAYFNWEDSRFQGNPGEYIKTGGINYDLISTTEQKLNFIRGQLTQGFTSVTETTISKTWANCGVPRDHLCKFITDVLQDNFSFALFKITKETLHHYPLIETMKVEATEEQIKYLTGK